MKRRLGLQEKRRAKGITMAVRRRCASCKGSLALIREFGTGVVTFREYHCICAKEIVTVEVDAEMIQSTLSDFGKLFQRWCMPELFLNVRRENLRRGLVVDYKPAMTVDGALYEGPLLPLLHTLIQIRRGVYCDYSTYGKLRRIANRYNLPIRFYGTSTQNRFYIMPDGNVLPENITGDPEWRRHGDPTDNRYAHISFDPEPTHGVWEVKDTDDVLIDFRWMDTIQATMEHRIKMAQITQWRKRDEQEGYESPWKLHGDVLFIRDDSLNDWVRRHKLADAESAAPREDA